MILKMYFKENFLIIKIKFQALAFQTKLMEYFLAKYIKLFATLHPGKSYSFS